MVRISKINISPIEIINKLKQEGADFHISVLISSFASGYQEKIKFVAENEDGEILGIVVANPNPDFIRETGCKSEIEAIYVLPKYRKKGIGTKLIIEAVKYLKEKSLTPIYALVTTHLARALIRGLPESIKKEINVVEEEFLINLSELVGDMNKSL